MVIPSWYTVDGNASHPQTWLTYPNSGRAAEPVFVKPKVEVQYKTTVKAKAEKSGSGKGKRMRKENERRRRDRSERKESEDTGSSSSESSGRSDERERERKRKSKSKRKPAAGSGDGERLSRIRKVATPGSRPVGEQGERSQRKQGGSRESSSDTGRTAGGGHLSSDTSARSNKQSLSESSDDEVSRRKATGGDEDGGETGGGGEVEVCLNQSSVDAVVDQVVEQGWQGWGSGGSSGSQSRSSSAGSKLLQHGRLKHTLRPKATRKLGPMTAPSMLADVPEETKGCSGYEESSDDEAFTNARKSNQRDRYEKRGILSGAEPHPCTLEGNMEVYKDYLRWSEKIAGFTTTKTGQMYSITLFKRTDCRSLVDYMTETLGPDFRMANMIDFHDRERHVSAVDAVDWIEWAAPGTDPTDSPYQ